MVAPTPKPTPKAGPSAAHEGRRHAIIIGLTGLLVIGGYAAYQTYLLAQPSRTPATASAHEGEGPGSTPALPETPPLEAAVARARYELDVAELEALHRELAAAETPQAPLLRAEVAAARALEASVRSRLDPTLAESAGALRRDATAAIADATEREANATRLAAARARLALASGEDLTQTHPRVLMPSYRDPELRAAALARPVWYEDERDPPLLEDVAAALRASPPTGLVRMLLALTLHRAGASEESQALVAAVLEETPEQPLALLIAREAAYPPSGAAEEAPRDPQERPAAAPAQAPNETAPRAKAPPRRDFATLASEGCRLVRQGEAARALTTLREAFDLQPGSTKVVLCMADAHRALGNDASARALVDRVLRSSPSHTGARLLAARLERERGNTAGALAHYREILSVDPENPTAKAFLEEHGP